jgi:hypothetical protein
MVLMRYIDAEIDAVRLTMQRQGEAALECDEYEAGAQAMKLGQKKLYALMCEKFGAGWDKLQP